MMPKINKSFFCLTGLALLVGCSSSPRQGAPITSAGETLAPVTSTALGQPSPYPNTSDSRYAPACETLLHPVQPCPASRRHRRPARCRRTAAPHGPLRRKFCLHQFVQLAHPRLNHVGEGLDGRACAADGRRHRALRSFRTHRPACMATP